MQIVLEFGSHGVLIDTFVQLGRATPEFFDRANTGAGPKDRVTYFNAMYDPADVVERGWRDLLRGRDVSTYGFIARAQIVLVKLIPHRLVMSIWCGQQKIR